MTSDRQQRPAPAEPDKPGRNWRAPRPMRTMVGEQELHKTGIAGFDPRDPYYFAVSISWSRFFLLFVAVEIAINLVFASLYALQPGSIANAQPPRFVSAFFFSLETLATVGYGAMYPATLYAHIVSGLEIMTGVIFMAIMTGLLFFRFSKARANIRYAAHPVVTRHNGKPTLMLRLGNARFNALHDARICLYTVVQNTTMEGRQHFNVEPLPLVRDHLPVFALHWTIMHVLDDESTLRRQLDSVDTTPEKRLFLTLSARDPTIGQQVSDLHSFNRDDIRHGMRYVDAIERVAENRVVADYALLSAIEPDLFDQSPRAPQGLSVEA